MSDYRHDILGPNGLSTKSGTFTMKSPLMGGEGGSSGSILLVKADAYSTDIGGYALTPDKTFSEVVEAANNDAVILCKMELSQLFGASGPVPLTLPLTYDSYGAGFVVGHGIVYYFGNIYCVYLNWTWDGTRDNAQIQKIKLTVDNN